MEERINDNTLRDLDGFVVRSCLNGIERLCAKPLHLLATSPGAGPPPGHLGDGLYWIVLVHVLLNRCFMMLFQSFLMVFICF